MTGIGKIRDVAVETKAVSDTSEDPARPEAHRMNAVEGARVLYPNLTERKTKVQEALEAIEVAMDFLKGEIVISTVRVPDRRTKGSTAVDQAPALLVALAHRPHPRSIRSA